LTDNGVEQPFVERRSSPVPSGVRDARRPRLLPRRRTAAGKEKAPSFPAREAGPYLFLAFFLADFFAAFLAGFFAFFLTGMMSPSHPKG
jgi:hypothetical protein